MKTLLYFLKSNNINYTLLSSGVLVEKKFILTNKENKNFSSNLKVHYVDFKNTKEYVSVVSKELNLKLGLKLLKATKKFVPQYSYSDSELLSSWNSIKSNSTWGGNKLIKHFHSSLLTSNYKGAPSPKDFFSNKKNVYKVALNRLVYSKKLTNNNILDGASISKLNPRVSVFSPSLAKSLLLRYASEYNSVLDPFSGFSGRALGAVACGKTYAGSDVRHDVVRETNELHSYLGLPCNVTVCDYRQRSNTTADVLFTCPPYSNKEQWVGVSEYHTEDDYVEYVLRNYNCKRYLFVVQSTKYSNNVVCSFKNGSWVKSNKSEHLLLFNS